jgi:hypothetical protein
MTPAGLTSARSISVVEAGASAFGVVVVVAAHALDAVGGVAQNGGRARPAVDEPLRLLAVGRTRPASPFATLRSSGAGRAFRTRDIGTLSG